MNLRNLNQTLKKFAIWLCAAVLLAPMTAALAAATASTTTMVSAANPVNAAVPVLLTASVTGVAPSGTVTFWSGGTTGANLGTATLTGSGSTRTASVSYAFIYAGAKSLTAIYSGDAANLTSTSPVVSVTVNKATSTTALTSSANPSSLGASITLSASVAGSIPSGTVTFKDGATTLGTGTITAGVATLATTALTAGAHSITAVYGGDTNNNTSTSAVLTQTVNAGAATASTTTMVSAANPVNAAVPVLLTASVTGVVPSGTVTFWSGGTTGANLGTATLTGSGSTRTASVSYAFINAGAKSLTAIYSGDAANLTSTSPVVSVTVNKATSTTALTSSANPSSLGASITLRASVAGSIPSGTVTFKDGATTLGTGTITGGVATLATTALTAGAHSITAVYGGDTNNNTSTSAVLTQTVNAAAATSTTVSVTPNPANLGQSVNFSASVSGSTPSGTVTFKDGSTVLGSATLSAGTASFSSTSLAKGGHSITASYGGDATNAASTSASVLLLINAAGPGAMTWQYGYDAMGRPTTMRDPNGLDTRTYYDSLGRAIQTEEPANVGAASPTVTQYAYNGADSLTKVTDPRSLATNYSPNGLGAVTTQASPDTGTTQYTFDAKGNVLSQTDARGKLTQYSYDALDRLTTITYPSGSPTVLEYDGGATPTPATKGELTKLSDASGSLSYAFDAMGRLTAKTQLTNGKTFVVRYTWGDSGSALDKLTAITYPSGSRVNYSYDAQGFLAGASVSPVNANGVGVSGTTLGLLSAIGYTADNQFKSWAWQNGTTQSIGYDSYGQIASYNLGDAAGTAAAAGVRRSVVRDAAGRIIAFTHTNNGTPVSSLDQSFGYDDLNRLLSANLSGTSTQYNYDASGNRTKKVVGAATYTNTIDPASNRVTQTQDVGGTFSIQYDAAGHVINDGVNSYSYSDRGRMSTATTAGGSVTYLYNGLELRVAKSGPTAVVPTGAAYYVYDEQGQLLGEYDANQNPIYETIYLGANPVGALKQTGTAAGNNIAVAVYNVHADHLGAPRVITRSSDRAIVWRWDSAESFGGTAPDQNPNALGVFVYNQRFPGQTFDSETGLVDNWNRTYDARQGRYRQSDPIGLAGGINTYSYVEGDPLRLIDPYGLFGVRDALGFVPVVGSGLDAYDAFKCGNYGRAGFNLGLAVVDATGVGALVKGLAVGTMKWSARGAIKEAYTNSSSWDGMRRRLQDVGEVARNSKSTPRADWMTTDHIFVKQRDGLSHGITNHPANLQTGVSQSLNSKFEYMNALQRAAYLPTWMKTAAAGAVSYGTGLFVDSGSECGCN